LADAALVIAQDSDASAGEVIGEDKEGTMPGNGFVAVARAGTAEQEDSRMRFVARWKGKRTSKVNTGLAIFEHDILGTIRIRRCRLLGPPRPCRAEGYVG
jgi:hypothetical protein